MDDVSLINLYNSWNTKAFWDLYDKYIDSVYSFVFHKTYDKNIAEDLTSDTFFKAFKSLKKFDTNQEKASFKSWIYKIAYNNVVDFYRQKKEEIWLEEFSEFWYENDLWQQIDNKEKIKEVLSYLNWLDKEHREILIMRLWDNLSYAEISQITWKTVDNCKKIVSRTLIKINWNITLLLILLINL